MDTSTFDTSLDPQNPIITDAHYREVRIPKYKLVKGVEVIKGHRVLHIPCEQLMQMQRNLLNDLQACSNVNTSNVAHAFMPNRSIKTMAERHVDQPLVIRIDIKDFFPTINSNMVREAMFDAGYPTWLIRRTLQICFYKGSLPQGAPTSPLLSNVVGRMLDKRIIGLCKSWRHPVYSNRKTYRHTDANGKKTYRQNDRVAEIRYTRYADDLVFSSSYKDLPLIINPIAFVLKKAGFTVNRKKISVNRKSSRQIICGITVNEKLSKPKPYRKRVRAMLHNMILDNAYGHCSKGHYVDRATKEIKPINFQKVQGLIAHIRDICDSQAIGFERMLRILNEVIQDPRDKWSELTRNYLRRHQDALFI